MSTDANLIDKIWQEDQVNPKPQMGLDQVWRLEDTYTGETVQDKYLRVGNEMGDKANLLLLTTLDDIAWLLNLRGSDIPFNPVFFSYLIFHNQEDGYFKVSLFTD